MDEGGSRLVFRQGYGRGLDLETVRSVDAGARGGLWPALTFLLDCPATVGLARARERRDRKSEKNGKES